MGDISVFDGKSHAWNQLEASRAKNKIPCLLAKCWGLLSEVQRGIFVHGDVSRSECEHNRRTEARAL